MAKAAYDYTRMYIKKPARIRPDDVVEVLAPALRATPKFVECVDAKRLREKYWPVWFAEYSTNLSGYLLEAVNRNYRYSFTPILPV